MTNDPDLSGVRSQAQALYQEYDQQELWHLDGWMSDRVDEIAESLTDAEGEIDDAISKRDERITELEGQVESLEQQITEWEDGA
jgi:DNA anti-recombination protein RmuC